jgi:Zn2+/Cd2+-exporting ATPase
MSAALPPDVEPRSQTFVVEGMCCAAEAKAVESRLRTVPGVSSVQASPVTGRAVVVHRLDEGSIRQALQQAGFRARLAGASPSRTGARFTIAALVLTLAGAAAGLVSHAAAVGLFLAAIVIGGTSIARKGWQRARHGSLDMNALMTIAVLGAMAIGEWGEGASTVVLFSLAQLLEARTMERARHAIRGLMRLAPDTARLRRAGAEERVGVEMVEPGAEMIVGPGERVPLDGVVLTGTSDVDQSPLTGESRRLGKRPGDDVFAGSINGAGVLAVKVTKRAADTTLARVLRRVEEAQGSRAPTQGFVDSFARVYTPVVVLLAALLAVAPPLFGYGTFTESAYRALVLLVIACPCALVISTPVSIVSALTAASRAGVLIKGGAHLEAMGRVRAAVFDKTGTLTLGDPVVVDVQPSEGHTREELLALAAAVETRTGHPVGDAVAARARAEGIAFQPADDVTVFPGRGAQGHVGGRLVVVGSHRLFDETGRCNHRLDGALAQLESEGRTAVLVGIDGEPDAVGILGVGDGIRPEAAEAAAALRTDGVHVAMLTGDNARTADALGQRLGIEDRRADLLPEDKVTGVRALMDRWGEVAMVGDGVNDAPALATATVGIAMGRRGTDVALETADVVLMQEDLRRIPDTIRLGRRTRGVIRQNIALSLAVKALVLGLALAGLGSLWAAVAADMGASLLVIGNGLRLLRGNDGGDAPGAAQTA